MMESETAVREMVDAPCEAAERSAAEPAAEIPPADLPAAEVARPEMSTPRPAEPADAPAAEAPDVPATTGVPAGEAAAVAHAERDTSVQHERDDDDGAEAEDAVRERAPRLMLGRERHGRSLVASFGPVNPGGPGPRPRTRGGQGGRSRTCASRGPCCSRGGARPPSPRSEEHTSELQSHS